MRINDWPTWASLFLLISIAFVSGGTKPPKTLAGEAVKRQVAPKVTFMTAEELKGKLSNNKPITIIDVQSANGLDSDQMIKGAFYVKLRRLKYRLSFRPLKDVPRNRDIVLYCACPNDEASIRAAQILRESGFQQIYILKGGWVSWKKANGQTEPMVRGM